MDRQSHTEVSEEAAPVGAPAPPRVHKRTLALGAVLVAAISYVALYVDLVVKQMPMGVLQFAPGAVGAFFIVYAAVRVGKRFRLLRWLNAADLLVLYLMLFIGVFVCTRGLIEKLIPTLAYADGMANQGNGYKGLLFPHLNPLLVVGDPRGAAQQPVAAGFFNGLPRQAIPYAAWVVPCAAWFGLFLLVIVSFVCLAGLLRRQWSDVEKLPFPHTVLPLEIFDDDSARDFFRNKLTWAGIALPFVIYGVNGLHQSYPTVPQIPLAFENLQSYLTAPPWNSLSTVSVYLSFAAIGFAYLLPTDLLFSLWFFFLLARLGDVVGAAYNLDMPWMPSYPCREYLGYQAAGAYVALAFTFFYGGRHVYGKVIREGFRFGASAGDANELVPRRAAVWGIILAFLGILAWSAWAGISLWLAVPLWLIYLFVTALVLTRSVSQAGLLMTETSFRPGDVVALFVPKAAWGAGNIVGVSLLNAVFFRDMRGLFLALFMDAQQMAGGVRVRRRALLAPLALGLPVAFVVGVATHLQLAYTHGAGSLYNYGVANAGWAFDGATTDIHNANPPFPSATAWFAVGIGVVALLTKMRAEFAGFPLQPIAYALAPTWTLWVLWFPFLFVWVIKSLFLRYGSQKFYRDARPFFLGLIVGEFGSAAFWAILASVFHIMAPLLPLP